MNALDISSITFRYEEASVFALNVSLYRFRTGGFRLFWDPTERESQP